MNASDYRYRARQALKEKWKKIIPLMILANAVMLYFGIDIVYQKFFSKQYYLYSGIGDLGYVYYVPVGIGWLVLALILALNLASLAVDVGRYVVACKALEGETVCARQLVPVKLILKVLAMNLIRSLLIGLQFILFIIPGIVALYRYSMADYLLAQNPDLGPVEALRESRKRMMGNKSNLFMLHLSFLGWEFLLIALMWMPNRWATYNSFPGAWAIPLLLNLLVSPWLSTYILMAETHFFNDIYKGSGSSIDGDESQGWQPNGGQSDASEQNVSYTVPDVDETVARDIFIGCGCSYNRLREEGLLEGYQKLNPSSISEERWKREYASRLMQSFDQEPEILGDLLALAAEYAMDDLLSRALERIERHIRQQTLPCAKILDMCGQVLAVLTSGAFDGNEGFIWRRKQQILDMANRLEVSLEQDPGDGAWRESLNYIRQMCG